MSIPEDEPFPWEIDVFTAKNALRHGKERPLASALREQATGLRLLAELADPEAEGATPQLWLAHVEDEAATESAVSQTHEEDEWVASLYQIEQAIKNGNTRLIGWSLRDFAEVLDGLADALLGNREWKLGFQRARRGKPRDPDSITKKKIEIQMHLWKAKRRGLPQKKVIAELEDHYGVSRSTIFRSMSSKHKRSSVK